VVSFVAIHLIGAVPVILNATLQPDSQLHCLSISQPKIVLVDARRAAVLGPLTPDLAEVGITEIYCWSGIGHLRANERAGIKEVGNVSPSARAISDVENGVGTETLNPGSDGMIMFTSGTTSQPKAVLLTQRGSLSHMRSTSLASCRAALREGADLKTALARFDPPAKQNSYLVAVPLFHVTGCLSWLIRAINTGSKVVFMRRWNVADAIKLIKDEKINVIGGVPAIVTSIVQSPLLPKNYPISNVSFGGAPPPKGIAKTINDQWPGASM
jgi:acyl-CoA synthetase (AMP-forming)/AMP-acid ligase II